MSQGLIDKIKEISQIDVSKKRETVIPEPTEEMAEIPISREGLPKIIAFGASIGGPQMLKTIFTKLPEHFPLPIVCVQRISGEFLRSLVDWLKSNCKVNVQIANSDMIPQKGTIYFPQPEKHLEFDAHDGTIILTSNPPFKGHRPSITVTFQSMAEAYGKDCIAVFLAGMGNDGMEGLESVQTAGGTTITQDKESSVVFLQAKQAIEQGLVDHVVNIKKMPTFLAELITSTA
jgi:two-component system chemotaxis response regulator CheB